MVVGVLDAPIATSLDRRVAAELDAVVAEADRLVADGADILEVGAMERASERPVAEAEALDHVAAVVAALTARFDVPISIGTTQSSVASAAYAAGAIVGDDPSGFADSNYLRVAADAGASVGITHIGRSHGPSRLDPDPSQGDVVDDVLAFLTDRAACAESAGIPRERIIIDAGLGLGKNEVQSLALLRASDRLAALGCALRVTASSPGFLDHLPGFGGGDQRGGIKAAHALAIALGSRILRARDVRTARRVADVMAAVLEAA